MFFCRFFVVGVVNVVGDEVSVVGEGVVGYGDGGVIIIVLLFFSAPSISSRGKSQDFKILFE